MAPQTDFIDRTLETLFSRGFADPSSNRLQNSSNNNATNAIPKLNLNATPTKPTSTSSRVENGSGTKVIETPDGPVWLSGNAVMCSCPECDAPVSVRLWLMVADCWRCESAMELSYEQQQAAQQLADLVHPNTPTQAPSSQPATITERAATDDNEILPDVDTQKRINETRSLIDIIRKTMDTLPAWLISTLVHLIMLLILALILLPQSFDEPPTITLSTAVAPDDTVGGVDIDVSPEDPLEYDTQLPPDYEKVERELAKVRAAADQDARDLLIDPTPTSPLPNLDAVKHSITVRTGPMYTMATRDPRLRNEMVRREGGTTLSEAAVSRGLKWLASVQNRDGSWSLNRYRESDNPRNRGDAAATSLALLPFLGAGQTHEYGIYKETVTRGLKWLIKHQKPNGDLRYGIEKDAGIYAHGQASIVLIEALAMTGDEQFRAPAQKAIDFIEKAQHKHGGWRYSPGESGDTSVAGWQLMALQSALGSNTGLRVDDATLKLANQYLDLASRNYRDNAYKFVPNGTLYRYLPRDPKPSAAMTAEGMLCRMYLGWKRDDSRMKYAVDWLLENALPNPNQRTHNLYYYYYATQVMHHYGGKHWETWNNHLRDLLIIKQVRKGRFAGSWDSSDFKYGQSGGRIYTTALAVCTLEVYYRHLPLFKQLDLD